jgi:hypothetical protein
VRWIARTAFIALLLALTARSLQARQVGAAASQSASIPDAPQPAAPQNTKPASKPAVGPCPADRKSATIARPPANSPSTAANQPLPAAQSASATVTSAAPAVAQTSPCAPKPLNPEKWFARFLTGPEVKPLTPEEKARLAVRNLIDPFNLITILGTSGISVAANSHSPYGPGMPGFGRNVGVSFTQDATGEFFNTFLIPSIAHQDPHYHRMPDKSIPRRALHAVLQVAWTQGDNGKGMLNYGALVGDAIDDEISNLYVPDRATRLTASAERYATGLASAPIDNFVSEFLPDVARHIHIQVVGTLLFPGRKRRSMSLRSALLRP